MVIAVLSPVVVVVSALLLILLERGFPYTKGQPFLRDGFVTDLGMYTVVQSYLLSWIIYGTIQLLEELPGSSRYHVLSSWPVWLQFFFFFVTHDLYIYAFHKWQHRNKYLYRIHEAHHSVVNVDWLAGTRSHAAEILINQTIEFAPIMLLGAAPAMVVMKGMVDAVWGMYIHSNIDVHSGRLQYIINGPEMHRWHHAKAKGNSINFSTKLAVWDWIFGTAYLPGPDKPGSYGLSIENFPPGYFAQQWFAFRPFSKRAPSS